MSIEATTISNCVDWALGHGLAFKNSDESSRHCPFTLSPATITREDYADLQEASLLLSRAVCALTQDNEYLLNVMAKMVKTDPLFDALFARYQTLIDEGSVKATPVLIMRSDFLSSILVEVNAIAAGMAPFGQLMSQFHQYMATQFPELSKNKEFSGDWVPNQALDNLAEQIQSVCHIIKNKHQEEADRTPTFLMVIQDHEDNIFDQHLLEYALQRLGIRTIRKTLKELAILMETKAHDRLWISEYLIDMVYLRCGYCFSDYQTEDDANNMNDILLDVRLKLEQHDIAMSATLAQQFVSSKYMQLHLFHLSRDQWKRWGITESEYDRLFHHLIEMREVNKKSIKNLNENNCDEWVLKNQGEGGGHCIFGLKILEQLKTLSSEQYPQWVLMRKIQKNTSNSQVSAVNQGKFVQIEKLNSEIGFFTFYCSLINTKSSLCGYLVRSKSDMDFEGGIHSGKGFLDSLLYKA